MRRRLRRDDGIVLIVAIIVLTIVMAMGLGVMALAESQNGPARDERWGRVATIRLPGGGPLGIYQPSHPRPD